MSFEPVNEVMRLASGYGAGQPEDDQAPVFYFLWGIAILATVLNILSWSLAYRRHQTKGRKLRLVGNLLFPLAINFGFLWLLFIGFPSSMDSDYSVMFVYLPDTSLIFLACAGIILSTLLLRGVVYVRSLRIS
jgi:hypothetical protein